MKIIFDHSHGIVKNDRVYCEAFAIPEEEKEHELLELGFLPAIEPPIYWYQAKSCRINYDKISLSPKRRKILSCLEFKILDYCEVKEEVDSFFYLYMEQKNLDFRNYYDKNSSHFPLKVMEVKHEGNIVAYTRFCNLDEVILGFETAFVLSNPRFSLGVSCILLLSQFGKSIGKNYTYIYESYPEYFPYKMDITGAEYWEGEKWVSP
jgi:hypothetical protein